ncbi:hypothetical protein COO60DRAFT_893358 [Scenedesmus sp. NREL 46B-D3]|nr:hypothetical protein COO60DRAFT_893358 [Scenedesmus sp. NREL 46B-D3]
MPRVVRPAWARGWGMAHASTHSPGQCHQATALTSGVLGYAVCMCVHKIVCTFDFDERNILHLLYDLHENMMCNLLRLRSRCCTPVDELRAHAAVASTFVSNSVGLAACACTYKRLRHGCGCVTAFSGLVCLCDGLDQQSRRPQQCLSHANSAAFRHF